MAEFDTMDERQRGYQAAKAGVVGYRHGRYWIDDATGSELCRPDVVKGITDWQRQQENKRIAAQNEQHYRQLAQDCAAQAETLTGDFVGWALSNAQLYTERADGYAQQAAR